jgi:hypothetical protein
MTIMFVSNPMVAIKAPVASLICKTKMAHSIDIFNFSTFRISALSSLPIVTTKNALLVCLYSRLEARYLQGVNSTLSLNVTSPVAQRVKQYLRSIKNETPRRLPYISSTGPCPKPLIPSLHQTMPSTLEIDKAAF